MTGFDYGVLIIGSGFGGSVAACGPEKGYRVGTASLDCMPLPAWRFHRLVRPR